METEKDGIFRPETEIGLKKLMGFKGNGGDFLCEEMGEGKVKSVLAAILGFRLPTQLKSNNHPLYSS